MRADRLVALLLLLQQRCKMTAREVADELEISERTARRDLEALSMSGVPIYSTSGRGGGWQLVGGAKTDLTGLSLDEARALFLAAGPATTASPQLTSAMRKLTSALPDTFRADAEAAAEAIKVDSAGWSQIGSTTPTNVPELTDAIIAGVKVRVRYEDRASKPSTRTVSPLGLVTKRGVWYLVSNTANGIRTFRLNRIQSITRLDKPVERPDGFNLDAEWERIVSYVQSTTADYSVVVLADPKILSALRYQFSGRIVVGEPEPDGRVRVTIREFGPRPLAAQLAGHGNRVEVVDPPADLRVEFVRLATELSNVWLGV